MAARGLDVPGIEHIVNFELPNDGVDPGEFLKRGWVTMIPGACPGNEMDGVDLGGKKNDV